MKIRHALVVLVLLVSGFGIFGPGVGPATAQEESVPTAALVEGTCRAPGNTVAELNELRVRDEGDVLASFTTVDASLDDILGSEHAVVLTDGGDVVACGDRFGTGGDVYVAVPATTPVGWGGIAWFHARNSGTQITLFVAQGLGGAGVAPGEPTAEPTEEPPLPPGDDDNETPVPPGDDDSLTPVPPGDDDNGTPIARATVTPRTKFDADDCRGRFLHEPKLRLYPDLRSGCLGQDPGSLQSDGVRSPRHPRAGKQKRPGHAGRRDGD